MTIKITTDDVSCSSYVSVSTTDLTVGTTNTGTDTCNNAASPPTSPVATATNGPTVYVQYFEC